MIKICFISDLHNKYKQLVLPDADIIVCAGDMTSVGKEHEIRNFLKWFSNLNQYNYKIFIAGNHDRLYDIEGSFARSLTPNNVIYLEDNGVEIMGLKFYGSPVQLEFCNWAFNKTEEQLKKYWKAIPDDSDIVVTHSPAYGILDNVINKNVHFGSPSLYDELVNRIKPLVSVCGHIHSGHGYKVIDDITFINAAVLNEEYELEYNPTLIEIDNNNVKLLNN